MSDQISVKVKSLDVHPAQIRTVYPLAKMASLTLSMLSHGYDADQPILVRKKGRRYEVIRGHRRRMAWTLANYISSISGDGVVFDIESVHDALRELTKQCSVETAVESLLKSKFKSLEVPALLFTGTYQESMVSLWVDSFNSDSPDTLGIALSLYAGLKEGISEVVMSQRIGQPLSFVQNHVALAQMPGQLIRLILDDRISISITRELMKLPEDRRNGCIEFLADSAVSTAFSITRYRKALSAVASFDGFQVPLQAANQTRLNVARGMASLWSSVVAENPDRTWRAVVAQMYNLEGVFTKDIWNNVSQVSAWVTVLTGRDDIWSQVLLDYVPVKCETCPIFNALPADETLNVDLTQPMLPCRTTMRGAKKNCLHGFLESDDVIVRLPTVYDGLKHVKVEGGDYIVKGIDNLKETWEARKKVEAAEAEAEEKRRVEAAVAAKKAKKPAKSSGSKSGKSSGAAAAPEPVKPEGPRPIDTQRSNIQMYMDMHVTYDSHFMATPCATCHHKLTKSPVKDETVPHCAFASGLKNVKFETIVADGETLEIAVCRQYKPNLTWRELIPAYPHKNTLNRSWMIDQIKKLSKHSYGQDRYAFEWLTGAGAGPNDRGDWFTQTLDEQHSELSDEQVLTLFVLVHAERDRSKPHSSGKFSIPTNATFTQFVTVSAGKMDLGEG
jgi:hypothetical protein